MKFSMGLFCLLFACVFSIEFSLGAPKKDKPIKKEHPSTRVKTNSGKGAGSGGSTGGSTTSLLPSPVVYGPEVEEGLVSPYSSTAKSSIIFENARSEAIQIYWIDHSGTRIWYKSLFSNASYEQLTFEGHFWVITDITGKAMQVVEAVRGPSKFISN